MTTLTLGIAKRWRLLLEATICAGIARLSQHGVDEGCTFLGRTKMQLSSSRQLSLCLMTTSPAGLRWTAVAGCSAITVFDESDQSKSEVSVMAAPLVKCERSALAGFGGVG
jgi:hypothetical protein